jgi:hypothetical protein
MSAALAEQLSTTTGFAGGSSLLGGLLLGGLARVTGTRTRWRCIQCGASTERGQSYCLDHLLQTAGDYREQNRHRGPDPRRPGR